MVIARHPKMEWKNFIAHYDLSFIHHIWVHLDKSEDISEQYYVEKFPPVPLYGVQVATMHKLIVNWSRLVVHLLKQPSLGECTKSILLPAYQ